MPNRHRSRPRAFAETTLVVDGLDVHVTRKTIRNLYLRVRPADGSIEVSSPARMSDERIADFVRERRGWIERQQQRLAAARRNSPTGESGAGEETFVWSDERRRAAAAAINRQLPALLAHWEPIVGRSPSHITLRVMSSRWGSCTPRTGRIRLNLQLGLMDERFLDYVLIHEMTHLWANGHGAEFQRRMDVYLPNWRQLRRELNRQVVL
ncbi:MULTISPECIES: SprT family zinc-dependent metalloprotease [Bifidobacterium]|jgi:predicted metal-dependent hydrolase|nr:SprT family zinc-dependent metalloprotease [Bifidobacterium tibiigranuli]MCI1210477.1 M48 family metallopeptidase [Bifidobacterium tibiigranuli]MCI1221063.1 M48 family metallopeptidase [Bifidobacterium tibiigranuli]MCI1797001.1 M48 family metallopeptidase [Bifidobacterium tibiigranuli]